MDRWLAGLIGGLRAVDAALLNRFGAAAERIDIELQDSLRPLSERADAEIDAATPREQGDEARLAPAGHLMSIQAPYASRLRREKGLWKVDLPAIYKEKALLEVGSDSTEMKMYLQAGRSCKEVGARNQRPANTKRSILLERPSGSEWQRSPPGAAQCGNVTHDSDPPSRRAASVWPPQFFSCCG